MSNKVNVKKRKPSLWQRIGQMRWTSITYWIFAIVLLIPTIVLGTIVLHANAGSGKPVVGSRFHNALDPAITEDQLTAIQTALSAESSFEQASVSLNSATVTVLVKTPDATDGTGVDAAATKAYELVTGILDPAVYFTDTDSVQMYDLNVHAYNLNPKQLTDETRANFIYDLLTYNAGMETYQLQRESEPLNADATKKLEELEEQRKKAEEENTTSDESSTESTQ